MSSCLLHQWSWIWLACKTTILRIAARCWIEDQKVTRGLRKKMLFGCYNVYYCSTLPLLGKITSSIIVTVVELMVLWINQKEYIKFLCWVGKRCFSWPFLSVVVLRDWFLLHHVHVDARARTHFSLSSTFQNVLHLICSSSFNILFLKLFAACE